MNLRDGGWEGIRVWVGENPGVGGRKTGYGWEGIRVNAIMGGKESGLRCGWEGNRVKVIRGGKESGSCPLLSPVVGTLYPDSLPPRGPCTRFPSHRGIEAASAMRPQHGRPREPPRSPSRSPPSHRPPPTSAFAHLPLAVSLVSSTDRSSIQRGCRLGVTHPYPHIRIAVGQRVGGAVNRP